MRLEVCKDGKNRGNGMYQRAAENENGNFVQAGYTGGTMDLPELPDEKYSESQKEILQETDGISQDTPYRERPPQNPLRNIISENSEILSRLKLSSLDAGDLLLAAILYFTLHDTGDDDLFWIAAILFFTGKGSGRNTKTDS